MTVQEALNQSAQELQQQLEEHRRLLVRAIEGDAGGIEIENCLRSVGGNTKSFQIQTA
ncbi:MAG: hypothetical protein JRI65_07005 [Deltaproteobacteria bacterium]|nr:hypothetical protein [Deltaproteobacteria bacterium]